MKKNDVNKMLNDINDDFIIEASKELHIKKTNNKIKKLILLGTTAACLCLALGTFYLTRIPYGTKVQIGANLQYDGIEIYYERETLSRIEKIMLNNKKGEKIIEFSNDNKNWYKMKNSNDIKNIICDDGTDVTKWKFINYSFENGTKLDIHWIMENVFSIGSANDIISITINGYEYQLDKKAKEKLYNDLLSLKYPVTDEELNIMENMSLNYSELNKVKIKTNDDAPLNFVIDQDNNILKLDEGVYSFFTVMTDNYFQSDSSGINLNENTSFTRPPEPFLDFESDAETITEQSPCP